MRYGAVIAFALAALCISCGKRTRSAAPRNSNLRAPPEIFETGVDLKRKFDTFRTLETFGTPVRLDAKLKMNKADLREVKKFYVQVEITF